MSHYCANDTFEPQFDMSLPGPNQTLYQIIELFKLSNYIDKDAVSDDLEYHSRDVTKILRACRIFWKWNAWGTVDQLHSLWSVVEHQILNFAHFGLLQTVFLDADTQNSRNVFLSVCGESLKTTFNS